MRRLGYSFLSRLAATLVVMGAINWGLVGLFQFNLVNRALGRWRTVERAVYGLVGLAGGWLGIALVLPRLLVALGVRGAEQARLPSIVGRIFPTLSGNLLSGRAITLPEDSRGKVTFVITGYRYESRFDVEDWTRAVQGSFGENRGVDILVVPIIGGVYRLFGSMIDEGMRRGSSAEEQEHTLTIYGSVGSLRKELGADNSSDVWVYLLDQDGTVLYQQGGRFDEARFTEMASLAEAALARRKTSERQRD